MEIHLHGYQSSLSIPFHNYTVRIVEDRVVNSIFEATVSHSMEVPFGSR